MGGSSLCCTPNKKAWSSGAPLGLERQQDFDRRAAGARLDRYFAAQGNHPIAQAERAAAGFDERLVLEPPIEWKTPPVVDHENLELVAVSRLNIDRHPRWMGVFERVDHGLVNHQSQRTVCGVRK